MPCLKNLIEDQGDRSGQATDGGQVQSGESQPAILWPQREHAEQIARATSERRDDRGRRRLEPFLVEVRQHGEQPVPVVLTEVDRLVIVTNQGDDGRIAWQRLPASA